MALSPEAVSYLKDGRSIAVGVLVVALITVILSKDAAPSINLAGCTPGAVADIGLRSDGKSVISYNGKVIDPKDYPVPATINNKREPRFQTFSALILKGSEQILLSGPWGVMCYQLDDNFNLIPCQ
ncbi:hypothetical protein [Methylococcus sp. EFPC2]|uniref:hypothetical protein n=1 Tax=Methylococcus sp. EFPC2 TaxID=2812648 RepID=UPI001968458B|nr:hypothetical protein [Methylococcus sp. EFPC2]QSA98535.1 hypothetical protein JWZ97_06985 [Methylococcus sp. EFPC2]